MSKPFALLLAISVIIHPFSAAHAEDAGPSVVKKRIRPLAEKPKKKKKAPIAPPAAESVPEAAQAPQEPPPPEPVPVETAPALEPQPPAPAPEAPPQAAEPPPKPAAKAKGKPQSAKKIPAKPKPSSLLRDMAYYRRTAKSQNMGANDRLYVLLMLKNKHADGKTDLAPLLKEIDRWEEIRRKERDVPPPPAADPSAPAPDREALPSEAGAPASIAEPPTEPSSSTGGESPPAARPVDLARVLKAGDVLDIQVLPAKELSRETIIQPDGTVSLPLIGAVSAQGSTQDELEQALTRELRAYVTAPHVRITLRQFSDNSVFVMGRVANPGPVPHRPDLRVLAAISSAGGFQPDAERSGILVYQGASGDRRMTTVDAQELLLSGGGQKDLLLLPGDVVDVPRRGNTVSILGMVSRPGVYPFNEGDTLLELLSESGGMTPGAKSRSVFLYRESESGRQSRKVNLDRILKKHPEDDLALRRGDIVMIPQKPFFAGSANTALTPWFYLATIVIAVVLSTGG